MISEKTYRSAAGILFAAACFLGIAATLPTTAAAQAADMDFDWQGQKIFKSYDAIPESTMTADSGDRNLRSFYDLRQYPGSPPRVPHPVQPSFADEQQDCLACHAKGGYSPVQGKYTPVTPHPELELCSQCHVPLPEKEQKFVDNEWQSINPPRLGRSALASSPPIIPHSFQLRENCMACHTGPGAVVEIRVEHASRGNCRQCHAPLVSTEPVKEFTRTTR